MNFLKYEADRGQMNLGRNQMTKLAFHGLKLEILGRKRKPSATGRVGSPRAIPLARSY